jgi:hypothetical protein
VSGLSTLVGWLASITSWLAARSWLLRATGGACLLAYVLSEPARALPSANAAEGARSPSAPTTSFDSEAAGEGEGLARRWAPGFLQHASAANPERDLPLSVDFDGDWSATNNWQHLTPAFRAREPSVYYSAILTRTHAYLTFTLFYPRDWIWPVCVDYMCHDNDLEVALVVVTRATEVARSELVLVETKAHNDYVALGGSGLDRSARPWFEVESQGHGMTPLLDSGSRAETAALRLVPEGLAKSGAGRDRSYSLVSLRDTLWAQRAAGAAHGTLWTSGESGFLAYRGARLQRRGFSLGAAMSGSVYAGGVRPAWGLQAPAGQRGDWFLDPAYVATARYPAWFAEREPSLEYVHNAYLEDLTRECQGASCPATPRPSRQRAPLGAAGGLLLGLGLTLAVPRPRLAAFLRRWQRTR